MPVVMMDIPPLGWGLAHTLKQFESGLHGVIKLIFQPAEEGTRGARAMVDAGVVDDVDYFTAVPYGTGVPAGTVVCCGDNFMATTKFDAHFTGDRRSRRRKTRRRSQCLVGCSTSHSCTACNRPAQRRRFASKRGRYAGGSGRNVVPASALLKVETRAAKATSLINMFLTVRNKRFRRRAAYGVGVETRLMGAATASSPSPQWVAWRKVRQLRSPGVNQGSNVLKRLRVRRCHINDGPRAARGGKPPIWCLAHSWRPVTTTKNSILTSRFSLLPSKRWRAPRSIFPEREVSDAGNLSFYRRCD